MNLSLEWTRHCKDQDEKDKTQDLVNNSSRVLNVLDVVLMRKLQESFTKSQKQSEYESPAWPYKQADYVGYTRALNEVRKLIDIHSEDQ